MDGVGLIIPEGIHRALWRHLLRGRCRVEEAAFCFGRPVPEQDRVYEVVDWRRVLAAEFAYQSAFHLELGDGVSAEIKRAHDMGASIIEFHSHVFDGRPSFSWSDLQGLDETAPHCLWRLKGRPYFAVVVSKGGFDGLAWFTRGRPVQLGWICSGEILMRASCETLTKL